MVKGTIKIEELAQRRTQTERTHHRRRPVGAGATPRPVAGQGLSCPSSGGRHNGKSRRDQRPRVAVGVPASLEPGSIPSPKRGCPGGQHRRDPQHFVLPRRRGCSTRRHLVQHRGAVHLADAGCSVGDGISLGCPGGLSAVVVIVERLVPDELWDLFQRVVPEAPVRPQGGGRRRHGDREVLAAIVFVATSGCTWQQLPAASFGPSGATAHRRFAEWAKARVWAKLRRLVLDELGSRDELDWSRCSIGSVNMRGLEDPLGHRADRSALVRRDPGGEPARQSGPDPAGERYTADPLSPRPTTA